MSNHPHYMVGCDAHKHYSLFSVLDASGHLIQRTRVDHQPGAIRAFIEAANVVVRQRHHPNWRAKYVLRLFERTRQRKGHAVAVGATARYLAEAAYWVLKKGEPYREPAPRHPAGLKSPPPPKQGQAPVQHESIEIRELIGPILLKMLMPHRGRIDVSGQTGLAWKAGSQTERHQQAPSWEEAFHFRQFSLDRGSAFIDVRPNEVRRVIFHLTRRLT